jgi:uncharacterized circularly permuted ATP-grasp superfamily protein
MTVPSSFLPTATERSASLIEHYAAQSPTGDEMWAAAHLPQDSAPKPHWQHVMDVLERLGSDELQQRSVEVQRLLRENGVTYSIYNDPHGCIAHGNLTLYRLLSANRIGRLLKTA